MKTNIDSYSEVNPHLVFKDTGFLKEYLNQAYINSIFVSGNEKIFNIDYKLILDYIRNEIKMDVEIICKFELDKESHFLIPKKSILFLFGDETNFIYYII